MNFKKNLNKLLLVLLSLTCLFMPETVFAKDEQLIVGGETIGINVTSKGVMVIGFYNIEGASPGKDAGLLKGDIITKVDDTVTETIDDLKNVAKENKTLDITYERNKTEYHTTLTPIYENGAYKTGIYIKNQIVGIGVISFILPSGEYGGVGHEIKESSSMKKFEIKSGNIYETNVTSIIRSEINKPGEKNADFIKEIGTIEKNTTSGIFGKYYGKTDNNFMLAAANDEITLGNAYIRTTINENEVKDYNIEIIKINKTDETKNILFKVTDEEMLKKTGGIVQGMSGSPIIQNNKIIGAVNYVVVDDPTKGYGIFINSMLKEIIKEQ